MTEHKPPNLSQSGRPLSQPAIGAYGQCSARDGWFSCMNRGIRAFIGPAQSKFFMPDLVRSPIRGSDSSESPAISGQDLFQLPNRTPRFSIFCRIHREARGSYDQGGSDFDISGRRPYPKFNSRWPKVIPGSGRLLWAGGATVIARFGQKALEGWRAGTAALDDASIRK
jgi:hypothetical protein